MPGPRRGSLALFYVLTFAVPVLLVGAFLLFPAIFEAIHGGPIAVDSLIPDTAAKAGMEFGKEAGALPTFIRLCLVEPLLWILLIGGAAPTIAAVMSAAFRDGGRGLREWAGRFLPWRGEIGPRAGTTIYVALFAALVANEIAVFGVRYALQSAFDAQYTFQVQPLSGAFLWAFLMSAFLDQGAFLEEPGWRGFALPRLQERMASPVLASVVLGATWAAWHVPRDFGLGVVDRLGVAQYAGLFFPAFLANCIAISLIAAYFCNRLGGSLLPAVIIHGLTNDAVGLSGHALGSNLTFAHQATKFVPLALFTALVLIVGGRRLGLRRAPAKASGARSTPAIVPA